jgi:hypothetical protein
VSTRRFNPATLFDSNRRGDPAYRNVTEVLNAVAAGKKAMWRESYQLSYITDGDEDFVELLQMAFDRGLAVVLHEHSKAPRKYRNPLVYILPLDQIWRISALNALHDTAHVDGRWSFSAEAQESLLLGYNDRQRTAWLRGMRYQHSATGCNTIYTVLDPSQREQVASLGGKSFGAPSTIDGTKFFFHRDYLPIKKEAHRLVPTGYALARVGLEWKASEALFGPWKMLKLRGVVTAVAPKRLARRLNASLCSKIEFLTRSGWR